MEKNFRVYLLGGMTLESEVPLPELPVAIQAADLTPDVSIRFGQVQPLCPSATEVDPGCFVTAADYLLHVPGIASYRVSHGCEIFIQPDAGALEQDVRAYLLGSIFAVLCHQRGLLPLHGSAVAYSGGVAAFLASSGCGKSSLAAHLAGRGFQIVADDVCLVQTRADGKAVVAPAAPWLKLWADSLEHLGLTAAGLDRVFSDEAKYRLPLGNWANENAVECGCISKLIFLERQEGPETGGVAAHAEIKNVTPLQAVPMLMSLTHQSHLLEAMGKREHNFLQCGRLASQTAVYRLVRPWGLEHMEATIDVIENLLRESS